MSQRQNMPCVLPPTMLIGSLADRAAIHRVARRIFGRHIQEGNRITWEQAKVDAERAWWDVHRLADVKQEQAS